MIIYIDIFLIENTILNLIVLVSTVYVSKINIRFYKLVILSFIGSIYTIIEMYIFSLYYNSVLKLIIKILVIIVCVILVCKGTLKEKVKFMCVFFMISFIYSGISYFVIYNFNVFSIKYIGISFVVSFILCYIFSKINNNGLNSKNRICNIEVYINNKNLKLQALIDSGNMVKDPVGGRDVIIIESDELKTVFDINYLNFLKGITEGKLLDTYDSEIEKENKVKDKYKYNINIIPFYSLGNPNGILCGIKPDLVKVFHNGEIILNNVLLGIYFGQITENGEYTSIIGLDF